MPHKVLLYLTLSYSFPILRPIARELKKRGHKVAWHAPEGKDVTVFFKPEEIYLKTPEEVKNFNADATLLPGNKPPAYATGIKVQLLHGINAGKKDEFKVRGYFDLYCTQGPASTQAFERARLKSPTFDIAETGWSKLDTLFKPHCDTDQFKSEKPVILYAPTFSPSLTSTYDLFNEITRLSKLEKWHWLIKLHPKAQEEEINMYRNLENKYFKVVKTDDVTPLLQAADVLLSDTSSILSEFALLKKPVVSFKNRLPQDWMINFSDPTKLESELDYVNPLPKKTEQALNKLINRIHPYSDGKSSARVADAVEDMIKKGTSHLKKKPSNWFRNFKNKVKGKSL